MDTLYGFLGVACLIGIYSLIIWGLYRLALWDKRRRKKERFCVTCEHRGPTTEKTPGSVAITLILLFFFIIPGLLYEVWRSNNRKLVCSKCGSTDVIPFDSPRALKSP